MQKKREQLFLLFAVLSLFVLYSCEKSGADYTEYQKQAFDMMHGSFKNEFYGITTTVTFEKHYTKPMKARFSKDGTNRDIHGEITITYWNGDSYKRYYQLSPDARSLSMYNDNKDITLTYYKEFEYINDNTFRWREWREPLWDTYERY